MRIAVAVLLAASAQGWGSDPQQLLAQAKRLLQQPGQAQQAVPLLREANQDWSAAHSNDPAYAESLDLYVALRRGSNVDSGGAPDSELPGLAQRAVDIYSAHPDTPSEQLALALEVQSDLLGRSGAGAQAWLRATGLRTERVRAIAATVPDPGMNESAARIGNGVSPPTLVEKSEPQYTEEARVSKISGSVLLAVVIDGTGKPHGFTLVQGCGYGLDEKAAEVVSRWRFRPGMRDGQPVAVRAQVQVAFRLLDNNGQPLASGEISQRASAVGRQLGVDAITETMRLHPEYAGQVRSQDPAAAPATAGGMVTSDTTTDPTAAGNPITAPPGSVRIGEGVAEANLVNKIAPVYPPLAKSARVSGTVRLMALITKEGKVEQLQLVSGHPLLAPAAMDAVREWTYRPTLLNGNPVDVIAPVTVNFTLSE